MKPPWSLLAYVLCILSYVIGYIKAIEDIKLGFLVSLNPDKLYADRYAGIVPRILEDINNDTTILKNYRLTYEFGNSGCDGITAMGNTANMIFDRTPPVAYIGPYCSVSCLQAGFLSTFYKIPMISFSCSSIDLSDKDKYPYFSRTKPYAKSSSRWTPTVFVRLMRRYNWTQACILSRKHPIYQQLSIETREALHRANIKVAKHEEYLSSLDDSTVTTAMLGSLISRMTNHCRGKFHL